MRMACITNDICQNIIEIESIDLAKILVGDRYDRLLQCPENGKIGDLYYNDEWIIVYLDNLLLEDNQIKCPICGTIVAVFLDICSQCGFEFSKLREEY